MHAEQSRQQCCYDVASPKQRCSTCRATANMTRRRAWGTTRCSRNTHSTGWLESLPSQHGLLAMQHGAYREQRCFHTVFAGPSRPLNELTRTLATWEKEYAFAAVLDTVTRPALVIMYRVGSEIVIGTISRCKVRACAHERLTETRR